MFDVDKLFGTTPSFFSCDPFSKIQGRGISNLWFASPAPTEHAFVFTNHCCNSEGKRLQYNFCHVTHTSPDFFKAV
jgi:hypothetical protein